MVRRPQPHHLSRPIRFSSQRNEKSCQHSEPPVRVSVESGHFRTLETPKPPLGVGGEGAKRLQKEARRLKMGPQFCSMS